MKLWLLQPRADLPADHDPWIPWYDKAFGFVVRAETEEEARRLAHEEAGDEVTDSSFVGGNLAAWLDAQYSTCDELTEDGEAGVVLRDFHYA